MQTNDDNLIFERYQQINEISNVAGTGQSYSMWNRLKSEFGQSKLGKHLGLFKGAQGQVDTERKANELTRRLQEFAGQTGQDIKMLMNDPASMANWLNQQVPQVVGDSRLSNTFDGSQYAQKMQPNQSPHDFFTYVINQTVKGLSQMPAQPSTPQVDTNVDNILQNLNALSVDPAVDPKKRAVVNNTISSIQKTFKGDGEKASKTSTVKKSAAAPVKATTTSVEPVASKTSAPTPTTTPVVTKPVTTTGPAPVKTSAPTPTAIPVSNTSSPAPETVTTSAAPKISEPAQTLNAPVAAPPVVAPKAPVKPKSAKKAAKEKAAESQEPIADTTEEPKPSQSSVVPKGLELSGDSLKAAKLSLMKLFPRTSSFTGEDRTTELETMMKAMGLLPGGGNDPLPQIKQYLTSDQQELEKNIKGLSISTKIPVEQLKAYLAPQTTVAAESMKRRGKMIYEKITFIDCRTI